MSKNIIIPSSPCYGCGSCVQSCPTGSISMHCNDEGFIVPEINRLSCVRCGLCEKSCPANPESFHIKGFATPEVCVGRIQSPTQLTQSSSGGVFQALARQVLRNGGVIAGTHFSKHFFATVTLTEDPARVEEFCSSKYLQSENVDAYRRCKAALAAGKQVLFGGTPCQVAGLYAYLGKNPDQLLTVDFACHGVPSPAVFKAYKDKLEAEHHSKVTQVNFRDKNNSWKELRLTVDFADGSRYSAPASEDPYWKLFLTGALARESCYSCTFTRPGNREADLTLGDAWRAEALRSDWQDDRGLSTVLVNTEKGRMALQSISSHLQLEVCDFSIVDQKYFHQPVVRHPDRDDFFRCFATRGIEKAFASYAVDPRPLYRRIRSRLKKIWHKAKESTAPVTKPVEQVEVFLFVDALGWQIVQDFRFLQTELPFRFPVQMQFGYSCSAIPTILTGKRPDAHGHLSFYYLDPEHSPFKGLEKLQQHGAWGKFWNRGRVRHQVSKLVKRWKGFSGYFQLYNMRFDRLKYFNYCEKEDIFAAQGMKPFHNLQDELQAAKIPYHMSNWRLSETSNLQIAENLMVKAQTAFYFIYTAGFDALLHDNVENPEAIANKLKFYANHIRSMLRILENNGQKYRFTVISDHGMTPLRGVLDLKNKVEALDLEFGKDYFACYDSTLFRVWYKNERARQLIHETVNSESFPGHYLTEEEKIRYGVNFSDHKFGDDIFLAEVGYQIAPSDMGINAMAGMHGFLPEDPCSTAAILSSAAIPQPHEVADYFSIMKSRIEQLSAEMQVRS